MNLKEACEIVYVGLNDCKHEWFEGRCVHCELTPDWSRTVMGLNSKLSTMKMELDECREKNLWLVNENLKLNKQLASEVERLTMELNAATLGEATKQDVMLDKMHAVLIAAEKYIEGVNADWPKGMDSDRDELIERIKSAKPDEDPDENS